MTSDADRLAWYARRVKALEGLLACYRVGSRPSEKLHRELALTRERIDANGTWRDDATERSGG